MPIASPFDGTPSNPNDILVPVAGLDTAGSWQAVATTPSGIVKTWADTFYINTSAVQTYEFEITRPNNTTPYTANDWLGDGTNQYGYEIPNVTTAPGKWFRMIGFVMAKSSVTNTNTTFGQGWYDAPLTTAQVDNAPLVVTYEDQKNFFQSGSVNLNFPGVGGSANVDGSRIGTYNGVCGPTKNSTSIWMRLEARNAYVPTANEKFYFRIQWMRL